MQSSRYFIMLLLCVFNTINTEYHYIRFLKDVTLTDIPLVGGKNASLGQMINALSSQGIRVPQGFAITIDGYNRYIDYNNLVQQIENLINQITDINDLKQLKHIS